MTNNPVLPARKTLEAIGISEFIPHIVGLDTCFASKPSEKILEKALLLASEDLHESVSYEDCISIGDRFDIDLDLQLLVIRQKQITTRFYCCGKLQSICCFYPLIESSNLRSFFSYIFIDTSF